MSAGNPAVAKMLEGYEEVIRRFISGQIDADKFETDFLTRFKTDSNQVTGDEFDILDRLFTDVDEYVADPNLRAATGGIDGDEFWLRAQSAYHRLYREAL